MSRRLVSWGWPLLALLVALSACRSSTAERSPATEQTTPASVELMDFDFGGDFSLTNQDGIARRLSDFRGRVVLMFFGYTTCPDACPLAMSKIASALQTVPNASEAVRTIFVSVDTAHDTPPVLSEYVRSFSVPLEGLTGSRQQIDDVVGQYRAAYSIEPSDSPIGHDVSHTTYTYLIDRSGRLRYVFRATDSPDLISAGVNAALKAPL